jgi:hypothetical protein
MEGVKISVIFTAMTTPTQRRKYQLQSKYLIQRLLRFSFYYTITL